MDDMGRRAVVCAIVPIGGFVADVAIVATVAQHLDPFEAAAAFLAVGAGTVVLAGIVTGWRMDGDLW